MPARVATKPDETSRERATAEKGFEFLLHEVGQSGGRVVGIGGDLAKGREVIAYDAVKERPLWIARTIDRRLDARDVHVASVWPVACRSKPLA